MKKDVTLTSKKFKELYLEGARFKRKVKIKCDDEDSYLYMSTMPDEIPEAEIDFVNYKTVIVFKQNTPTDETLICCELSLTEDSMRDTVKLFFTKDYKLYFIEFAHDIIKTYQILNQYVSQLDKLLDCLDRLDTHEYNKIDIASRQIHGVLYAFSDIANCEFEV